MYNIKLIHFTENKFSERTYFGNLTPFVTQVSNK